MPTDPSPKKSRVDAGSTVDRVKSVRGGKKTRGGWTPTGVAADRRDTHAQRGTARGVRSKQQIVDAARHVFETAGYFDATVEDIVREANISRGSFYTYFPSKREVFDLIEQDVEQDVGDAVRAHPHIDGGDAVTNLRSANSRYIRAYSRNAEIIGLVEQLATTDVDIRERRLKSRQAHVGRVADAIRRWQSQGLADPSVDAATTAAALVSMLSNFCYWWFVGGALHDEQSAEHTLTEIWIRAVGLRT